MTGFEMLRRARAGLPYTEEVPEVSVPSEVKLVSPSPPPKLAVPRLPNRADNAQLHVWLPASTMAAVQRWCAENNYYLKDFIIEAIEERLKRGYPR